jgi:predicted lactoylglutathione lyase
VLAANVPRVEQRISLITLGVSDLSRAKRFYEALGWRGQEVERTVFFQAGGMAVVLWGEDQLAADAGLVGGEEGAGGSFRGMSLAQNVRSRVEVDSVIAVARSAGASVTREPAETFYGGYAGYFTDPDGHAWEVAYNPGFTLGEDGALTLPDFGDVSGG